MPQKEGMFAILKHIFGLNSIYFKIICIIHTYMINAGIGFDNKIMNLILSNLNIYLNRNARYIVICANIDTS